jgi:PKD repeat protein
MEVHFMLKRMRNLSHPLLGVSLLILLLVLLGARMDVAAQGPNQDPTITWLFNSKANSDETNYGQHEPHLAISRTNPNVVVSVAKDYRHNNSKEVWIYVSQDGGQTWPADLQLHMPGLPVDVPNQSDPVTMARDDGRLYVECLGYDASGGYGHGIFITWSDDNGNTWQDPSVAITHNQTPGDLDDKDWFAIDNDPGSPYYHNMYVAWAYGGILFKRSTDGGLTWSTNYMNIAPGDTEYPFPVVSPNGTVYVFYMENWGFAITGTIKYVKSTNGGVSFSSPVTVTTAHQPDSPIHGYSEYDQFRFFSIITAAFNPTNPDDLWVAWTDDHGVYHGKTDVLYVHSMDGGASWSDHARLSHDDPEAYIDHITPVFSMSLDGRLHAFWLDRRADPGNHLWHGYHTSTLDGLSWENDTQVSEQAFDLNLGFPPSSGNAAGDYWGLDTVGNIVMAAWNTTVINNQQDIFVASGIYSTTTVTLTGQVLDAQSLLPIVGAEVSLDTGAFTTTNSSGYYTLTVEAGIYTATALAEGYFPQVVPDLPLWAGTTVQDFSLQPEVTLTGLVSDLTSQNPLAGAKLLVDTGEFTYTNVEGQYGLLLPPGVYTATATADGYNPEVISGIELISGTVTQDFALLPLICPAPEILEVTIEVINPLTLSFSPTVSSTLVVDYLWGFGDGVVSSDPAPVHSYADYGSYTVDLEVSNLCGSASWSREIELKRFIFLPLVFRIIP